MVDAIAMLRDEHKAVEALFRRFEQAGARAFKTKRGIVDRIIEELALHTVIEEQVFYPAVRQWVPGAASTVLEALEAHHIFKWTLSELEAMDAQDERFDAKVNVLVESVRRHVDDEEHTLFPAVLGAVGREVLEETGARMADVRRDAGAAAPAGRGRAAGRPRR